MKPARKMQRNEGQVRRKNVNMSQSKSKMVTITYC